MSLESPIFIVGTPRSGTTLTAKILGRHPELFMPGETHYFDDIYACRNELGIVGDVASIERIVERLSTLYERYYELPDQERISSLFSTINANSEILAQCNNYGDILAWFMRIQMEKEGKSRWGNNAPRDIFNYKDIIKFYPDAKIIICVRDLRDFLLSYQGKWKVTGDDHVERLKKLYHPVITSLLWKSSMKLVSEIKRDVAAENLIIVNYEGLVQEPEITVNNICKTIGVDFIPGMLEVNSNNSSNAGNATGIFSSSVERWRENLSNEEIKIAQILAKKELRDLGYSIEPVKFNFFKLLMKFSSTPFALWRALNANKDVRGPLIPYLSRRLSSLLRSR